MYGGFVRQVRFPGSWNSFRIEVNKQKMNHTPDQLHTDQMKDTVAFPVLSAAELEECAEFGTRCSFTAGEDLFRACAQPFDCYVILSGEVCIIDVLTDEPAYLVRLRGGGTIHR